MTRVAVWIKMAVLPKLGVSTNLTGLTKAPFSTKVAIWTKVKIWIQVTNLANLAISTKMALLRSWPFQQKRLF